MQISRKLQYRLLARNIRYSTIEGMAFAFMLGSVTPYLGLFILRFQGPTELVSLIAAIQPIILALVSFLAASYVNSFIKKKAILIPFSIVLRFFPLGMAVVPFLPAPWRAWALFGLWGGMFIPWGFTALSWSPMICNMVPSETRGRFFGTRNACTGVTTLLGTSFTGLLLAKLPFLQAFPLILVVAFCSTMVSLYFLSRMIEPILPEPGEPKSKVRHSQSGGLDLKGNLQTFRHPVYGRSFTLNCLAVFIFHIGYSMTIPLYVLRLIKDLNYSNADFALITTAQSLTALLGSYLAGRSADRWGYRYVLLYSTLFSVIPPLIWACFSQLPWLISAAILAGFTGNAYLICFFYMVLAVSPEEDRSRFVAVNTFTGNLAGTIGPLIGLLLISTPLLGIQGALITASLIMLCGAIISYRVAKQGKF